MDDEETSGMSPATILKNVADEMQSAKHDKSVCVHVDEETRGSWKTCVNRGVEHVDGETGVVSQVISRIDGRPSVDGETSAVSQVADSVDGETSMNEATCVNKGPEQVDGETSGKETTSLKHVDEETSGMSPETIVNNVADEMQSAKPDGNVCGHGDGETSRS
jgi:hypothetical protein